MTKPRETIKGFIDFIRTQGVVGLAIAFILGGAITKVVSSLVSDIVQPLIGMIFGSVEGLSALHFGAILYGHFITEVIDFLVIAWIVYVIFKRLGLERLDIPKSVPPIK